MPHQPQYHDPDFWRARAEEMRVVAERLKEIGAKAIMFGLAEDL